jgi:hypothetical protein
LDSTVRQKNVLNCIKESSIPLKNITSMFDMPPCQ